jgi:hypothetical protein
MNLVLVGLEGESCWNLPGTAALIDHFTGQYKKLRLFQSTQVVHILQACCIMLPCRLARGGKQTNTLEYSKACLGR